MLAKVWALMGATVAVGLIVAGLWGWTAAGNLVGRAARPELALWAVRSAAVAAIAAAQVLGMTLVAGAFYPRDRAGELLGTTAGLVCMAGLVGAIVLGIVSR